MVIGKALTIAWGSLEVDNTTFMEDLSCRVTACCGCLYCYSKALNSQAHCIVPLAMLLLFRNLESLQLRSIV